MSSQQHILPQIFRAEYGRKYGQQDFNTLNQQREEIDHYLNIIRGGLNDGSKTHRMQVLMGENARPVIEQLLVDRPMLGHDNQIMMKDGKVVMDSRWTQFNRMQKQRGYIPARDTTAFVHANEITAYNQTIQEVIRWQAPDPEIVTEKDIGRGLLKYTYFKAVDVPAPGETLSFEQRSDTKPMVTDVSADLLGFYYDYHLSMPQKDASMNPNALYNLQPAKQQFVIQELTKSLAVYKQWYHYRGTSIDALADLGLTGLLNDSNVSNQTTIGNSGSLVTYGNILSAAATLSSTLIQARRRAPFVLDLSPGVFMQANKNQNTTSGKTELQALFELTDNKKNLMFSDIRINPFMIAGATETNSTAAMACYKVGQKDFEYIYSYPMGYYPLPPTNLGVDGKLLFMGRPILMQPSAIAYGGSLTVNVFQA